MEHGGDLISYRHYYHGELVDFSSNINPLGPPKGLEEVLIEAFKSLEAYPDIKYRKLKTSLSLYLKCQQDNILVGNGAVELINNFVIPVKRVVVMTPSFSEYEQRAIAHGKEVVSISYNKDFIPDIHSLSGTIKQGDLLIVGNPNNPTGLRIDKEKLIEIYKLIIERDAYLLLDEAFYEFCPQDYDSIELFKPKDYKGVGIIRAATKFFGLPGIRLGYGCASKETVREIEKIALPWSVNALADIAGQFIFKDKDYIEKAKAYIEKERNFLLAELSKLDGMEIYNTHTNYILIKLEDWDEEFVFQFFLKRGLMVRKCSSFKGLSHGYVRVAIKDRKNNLRLIKAFDELIRRGKG